MTLDHIGIHQKLIENTVSHLTWHDQAVEKAGFKAISQVWLEPPVWLFWLEGCKGAFMLRILEAEQLAESAYCTYLLHYFPESTEALTEAEKELILSDKFDKKTCTPEYEHNTEFHHYFITAEIGIAAKDSNSIDMAVISRSGRFADETEMFFGFFFKALNFYSKSHHISCMKDKENETVLLPYSMEGMMGFFSHFQLNPSDFAEEKGYRKQWCEMAHFNAACSVNGTCSCSH